MHFPDQAHSGPRNSPEHIKIDPKTSKTTPKRQHLEGVFISTTKTPKTARNQLIKMNHQKCLQNHREQDSHSKHLQVISGAPIFLYWLANAIWDGLAYGLSASAILGLIAIYHQQGFSGERLWAATALLAGFGPAGLSMTYLLHFMFTVGGSCTQRYTEKTHVAFTIQPVQAISVTVLENSQNCH